jgi:hypothetical protein
MANTVSNISNLDFASIRQELKDFLQDQEEFIDYDFEGSGISSLVDLLAYNTHMNAMMAHLTVNEPFLETAQLRSNIVSHAYTLGYIPKSAESAKATLDVVVTGTAASPTQIVFPDGFKFSGKINSKEYTFITDNSYVAIKDANNQFTYNDVSVIEGKAKTDRYNVDGLIPNQQFILTSDNADITTLKVTVYENASATIGETYTLFTEIATVGPRQRAYFLKENQLGKYSVFFGDNNISLKPTNGSVIELTYIETVGKASNGVNDLNAATQITDIDPTVASVATSFSGDLLYTFGGRVKEGDESIRRNAPIYHATQDRAVTANDYRSLILNRFQELVDCSVWGGEEADPPIYGKVFIAPAVPAGEKIPSSLKSNILAYLKNKNIGAIVPEILDSEYAFIELFIGVNYNPNKTQLSVANLKEEVRSYVTRYNNEILNRFNTVFRASNFLSDLDSLDEGIISSVTRTKLYKILLPNPTKPEDYSIKFPCRIYAEIGEEGGTIQSSIFQVEGVNMRVGDEFITDDPLRLRLFFYDAVTGNKINQYNNVGYIDLEKGEVVITNVKFDLANPITLKVQPDSYDIAPIYNQLIYIKTEDVNIEMRLDTISVNGSNGIAAFKTFGKHED